MHRRCLTAAPVLLMVIALAAGPLGAADTPGRAIDPDLHHLGNDNVPEWKSLTSVKPEGREIDLGFTAKANDTQHTLRLDQQDVDEEWQVKLNERTLGTLKRDKAMRTLHLAIPPGTLADGDNRLTIRSRRSHDDIIVGRFHLFDQTLARVLRLGEIRLHVTDLGTGKPVPARVTLTDEAGRLVELHSASGAETAIRPGVVYTLGGGALVALPEGRYTAYATRGTEWSLDRREVAVRLGQTATARFSLRREVDTRGFVAADTHIHTLTHSGHGDASIEERMITLAGEGVELAVATDHDHNIDYRPVQQKMKLTKHFTPVVG
ncbi:MAG: hypothetical protein OER86_10725, partial [Phycisphaerae bacterium]|nr:hypothetical protein [Phycisphaerae bacterium]